MPRFAANLTLLFKELLPVKRIAAAAQAGFAGCEILFPDGQELAGIRAELDQHGLGLALINTPSFAKDGLPCAPAADPARIAEFRESFRRSLAIARDLRPDFIHVMSGPGEGGASRNCLIQNLKWAAETAGDQRMTIEPINRFDVPGYFLSDFDLALDILDAVGAPNLGLQFDVYHAHKISGAPLQVWQDTRQEVVHIQVGGIPDRNEPIATGFDYPAFFKDLDAGGYSGWVSGEYNPATSTKAGLGWLTAATGPG